MRLWERIAFIALLTLGVGSVTKCVVEPGVNLAEIVLGGACLGLFVSLLSDKLEKS